MSTESKRLDRKLLTVSQVAEILDVPEGYVRRLMYERRLAFIKFGEGRSARVKIDQADLDAFIAQGRVSATGAAS